MKSAISIIGQAQTSFGEHWDKSLKDLMEEAVGLAVDDATCAVTDIDLVIVANMLAEATNNQAHLGALASQLLPHNPPALRVESACASGAVGIATACGMLESGKVETVLVVGVEKMTDQPADAIAAALMGAADSEKDAPSGLTFPGIFGLIANRYMYEYGLTREQLNLVSARHHANAAKNLLAQFRNAIPAEAISQSPTIADPLCLLDCSPLSDGAAAVVLSTKQQSPTRIAASQITTDTVSLTERDSITSFPASKRAAEQAFDEAGIDRSAISHLETHDCFSITALINLEDLGLAEPGQGIELYETEAPKPSVNTSGGLKACGHPVAATGVKQIIDVAKQLQSSHSQFGLAHNFGGACATCAVHILENRNASPCLPLEARKA